MSHPSPDTLLPPLASAEASHATRRPSSLQAPVERHHRASALPTILYAEDDPTLRIVTQTVLESFGFRVLSAGVPKRALLLFRRHASAIDLLLTDVEMPGMSGLELAQTLSRLRPNLPVLIVSGAPLPSHGLEDIQSHGWEFLAKPVPLPLLEARLRGLLSRSADLLLGGADVALARPPASIAARPAAGRASLRPAHPTPSRGAA